MAKKITKARLSYVDIIRKLIASLERGIRPSGAVFVQQRIGSSPERVGGVLDDVERFRERAGVSEFYVLHGVVFISTRDRKTVALVGPSGIGKSTTMRRLSKEGLLEPVEEGHFIFVTQRGGKVLRSGTLEQIMRYSTISSFLRKVVGEKTSFQKGRPPRGSVRQAFSVGLMNLSRLLAALSLSRTHKKEHEISFLTLHRLVLFTHERYPTHGVFVGKENAEAMLGSDVEQLFQGSDVSVVTYDASTLTRNEMTEKMCTAL